MRTRLPNLVIFVVISLCLLAPISSQSNDKCRNFFTTESIKSDSSSGNVPTLNLLSRIKAKLKPSAVLAEYFPLDLSSIENTKQKLNDLLKLNPRGLVPLVKQEVVRAQQDRRMEVLVLLQNAILRSLSNHKDVEGLTVATFELERGILGTVQPETLLLASELGKTLPQARLGNSSEGGWLVPSENVKALTISEIRSSKEITVSEATSSLVTASVGLKSLTKELGDPFQQNVNPDGNKTALTRTSVEVNWGEFEAHVKTIGMLADKLSSQTRKAESIGLGPDGQRLNMPLAYTNPNDVRVAVDKQWKSLFDSGFKLFSNSQIKVQGVKIDSGLTESIFLERKLALFSILNLLMNPKVIKGRFNKGLIESVDWSLRRIIEAHDLDAVLPLLIIQRILDTHNSRSSYFIELQGSIERILNLRFGWETIDPNTKAFSESLLEDIPSDFWTQFVVYPSENSPSVQSRL